MIKVRNTLQYETPTTFSARDEFDQTAGNLNGKTLPLGGTWATSGAATDFAVEETGHTAQRATTSDAGYRFAIAGATNYANVAVQADAKSTNPLGGLQAVIARWTDASNFLLAEISGSGALFVTKTVAGTSTGLGELQSNLTAPRTVGPNTLRLVVEASGRWALWRDGVLVLVGQDSALATGGALATGKPGFAEFYSSATAATRNFDNFAVFAPTVDAVCFASRSIEFRSYGDDPALREDSTRQVLYTNLVTNPSFEVDTAGWTSGFLHTAAATLIRLSTYGSVAGTFALTVDRSTTTLSGAETNISGSFPPGAYTFAVWLRNTGGTVGAELVLSAEGGANPTTQAITIGFAWTRFTVTTTLTATRTNLVAAVRIANTTGDDFILDAAMVVAGSSAPSYFDGDSANALWTGTPHASTSQQLDPASTSYWGRPGETRGGRMWLPPAVTRTASPASL